MPLPVVDGCCLNSIFLPWQIIFVHKLSTTGGFFVFYTIKIKKKAEKDGWFEEKMLYLRVFKQNKINYNKI